MAHTLIIDTSFGSTVGILGHEPIVEQDSRTHVERLQANIASVVAQAGLAANDIDLIAVGIGPAPYTGLRVGVVTAKALAYATGARLVGQNILEPQAWMAQKAREDSFGVDRRDLLASLRESSLHRGKHLTLCVNDARRRQLYFALYDENGDAVIDMDIDYPVNIVERVNAVARKSGGQDSTLAVVDVVGHGSARYAEAWQGLRRLGAVVDASVLDFGAEGLQVFADCALHGAEATVDGKVGERISGGLRSRDESVHVVEPLYLRRPDVSVPSPLKHVLGPTSASARKGSK